MNWILYLILIIATAGTMMSLLLLLRYRPIRGTHSVSLRHFTMLVLVYITITLSFSILYLGFELLGIQVIKESGQSIGGTVSHLIEDVIYFSAVTLLSVGYGDLVPVGVGRFIAIVQALFGYLLPAAFVVTSLFYARNKDG
ncbi:ion channel [Halalkalibacter nanhaiisediminis]|uniref:Potassium channel LctB n=1 Tax=Halalkalibacter nanhaiisediminis TaxID=688079 RepID=A0A562Q7C7_9BACI|nr:ion channel [Halalkalibacter nanhaiisediminis]TWI52643.1 potassium channel LctB [Halalkalibacter nanhaiisediminis]